MVYEARTDLYSRIEAFRVDDGEPDLTFTARLARENGWPRSHAERVMVEYKRFMYLAVVSGHRVTPSDSVDQAWHLHLTYTRSYWDDLCRGVLGESIHHGPTRGGATEGLKYKDWYGKTLASYRRVFGIRAPRDIWPDASMRFRPTSCFERVDTSANWVVSKSRGGRNLTLALLAIFLAVFWCFWSADETTSVRRGAASSSQRTHALTPATSMPGLVVFAQSTTGRLRSSDESIGRRDPVKRKKRRGSKKAGGGLVVAVLAGSAAVIVLCLVLGGRCPQCRRRRVFKRTGRQRAGEGLFFKTTEQQWECDDCGCTEWKKKPAPAVVSCSGGGGCGGGCGG